MNESLYNAEEYYQCENHYMTACHGDFVYRDVPAKPATTHYGPIATVTAPQSTLPGGAPKSTLSTQNWQFTCSQVTMLDLKKIHQALATETQGHYIGPMPPHEFFDRYMPWNKSTTEEFRVIEPPAKRVAALCSMVSLPERQRHSKFASTLL